MNITYKNWTIKPGLHVKTTFDLWRTEEKVVKREINPQGKIRQDGLKVGDSFTKEEDYGSFTRLENAVEAIILQELAENEKDCNLQQYIDAYKKEREKILNLLK
jgi:hypothetical protein